MATGTLGPCDLPVIDNSGARSWSLKRDVDGHRNYRITHRVHVDREIHGPLAALELTPGLPEPGSTWDEGDLEDEWAFFTQEADVEQAGRGPDNQFFDVTQYATTKPTIDCSQDGRTDPLLFPDRVRIESINYVTEVTVDINGDPYANSAWELFRGPQAEYDAHRLRVVIEQNVADLEITLLQSLMHNLNDATMWGFDPRMIKFSGFDAEPKYHSNCEKYWLRRLTFDIASDFDRCILDEGTKVLDGKWDKDPSSSTFGQYIPRRANPFNPFTSDADPNNPNDFIHYVDYNGNPTRVILNGRGVPWDATGVSSGTADDNAGSICLQVYDQGNLFLLGVPLDLG